MQKIFFKKTLLLLGAIFVTLQVHAQDLTVPGHLAAPVILYDEGGNVLSDGDYSAGVILRSDDGSILYQEEHLTEVRDGVAHLVIGDGFVTGSHMTVPAGGLAANLFLLSGDIAVEILVEGQETPQEIAVLGSQPYAFVAEQALALADNAVTSLSIRDGAVTWEDLSDTVKQRITDVELDGTGMDSETAGTDIGEVTAQEVLVDASIGLNNAGGSTLRDVLQGLDQSIDTLREGRIIPLEDNATLALTDITTLQSGLSTTQLDVANLQTSLVTAQSDITTTNQSLAATGADVAGLEVGLSSVQTNVQGLQNDMGTLNDTVGQVQSNVGNLSTGLSSAQSGISVLQGSVGSLQASLGNTQTALTGLQTGFSTVQSDLGTTQAGLNNLTSSVTALSATVSTTQSDVVTNYLRRDSDSPMTDSLDMGGHGIVNVGLVDGADVGQLDSRVTTLENETVPDNITDLGYSVIKTGTVNFCSDPTIALEQVFGLSPGNPSINVQINSHYKAAFRIRDTYSSITATTFSFIHSFGYSFSGSTLSTTLYLDTSYSGPTNSCGSMLLDYVVYKQATPAI